MALIKALETAPDDVVEKRRALCRACDYRTELPAIHTEVCKACGCPLLNKTKFQKSTCPKGKW
ncbi:MAG: hypothetical protein WA777_12685 [Rhodanobacter sp.]